MKRCSKCGREKPLDGFYKSKKATDGLSSNCKECMAAATLAWRRAHPEQVREHWRRMEMTHASAKAAHRLAWRKAHPDRVRENKKAWRSEHRDQCCTTAQNSRARGLGIPGELTMVEWVALKEKFGNRCLCCGSGEGISVDHVIPLSKGGANVIGNIQPLCRSCNAKKHNRDGFDWRPYPQPVTLGANFTVFRPSG